MTTARTSNFKRRALAAAVVLALAGAAQAQLSTATIKGQVTAAQPGTPVVAVNKETGLTHRTTTREDGSYVLTGLPPGNYEIRVGAAASQVVTLSVGETAAVDLDAAAQQVTVTSSLARKDVRTSEVATSVSRVQLENLPQVTRNFLSFAELAPGVRTEVSSEGFVTVRGNGQSGNNVNVFIDGVSHKSNILRGGITGTDSSRGNPFPQSTVAEYKVVGQNYKAEYDQVSSTAITAITKSGTNELHGEVFADRSGTNWTALNPFEKKSEANGIARAKAEQYQFGANVGGAIKQDVLHYFVAYEGKQIGNSRVHDLPASLNTAVPNAGAGAQILGGLGSQNVKFAEHMALGKLDLQIDADQHLSLTAKLRREKDKAAEDNLLSTLSNIKDRINDETRLDLKHEWALGDFYNEGRIVYENYLFNPQGAVDGPRITYLISPVDERRNSQRIAIDGGSPDRQRREQSGFTLQDDLSYTGLGGHLMKGGAKLKALKYDLDGTSKAVDLVETIVDRTTGAIFYDGTNCTFKSTNDVTAPTNILTDQCRIERALAPVGVKFSNNQIGLYFQDDWRVTKNLELNLGVRWDYETNMLNNDYVTPADRVAAIFAPDVTRAGITPPAGQTYAQSLAKGGIRIEDYIADGKSRKTYKGALAPRLGGSYDIFGDKATVLFAGLGRAYDRTMANHALDELQKNRQPGGEIWMIRNDFKMPYADQLGFGVRQAVEAWNVEVGYTHVDARNQFTWFSGNRDPNGGWGTQSSIDPLWGGPNGFGSLILGDFVTRYKTDSVYLKAEKPYTLPSGWGAQVTYTYTDGRTTHKEWNDDMFNWTYGRFPGRWYPSKLNEQHRLVASGVFDNLLPWGLRLSAKGTFGSGLPLRITSCAAGWDQCVYIKEKGDSFNQLDLGVSREIKAAGGAFVLRADVINVFNTVNFGGYDEWGGGPGNPQNKYGGDNANVGTPNGMGGPMRSLRVGLAYRW
ncbi:MAG: TonB-dependent receptor [Burkholderiaceae bacterium]